MYKVELRDLSDRWAEAVTQLRVARLVLNDSLIHLWKEGLERLEKCPVRRAPGATSPRSPAARHPLMLFEPDLFFAVVAHERPIIVAPRVFGPTIPPATPGGRSHNCPQTGRNRSRRGYALLNR